MKNRIALLLLVSTTTLAQNLPAFSESDINAMMQKAQEMQVCMAAVDQSELKALETRWHKLETELQNLCAKGDRSTAQKKALTFSKETANSKAIQTLAKCGEGMREMMPEALLMKNPEDYSEQHVCDTL